MSTNHTLREIAKFAAGLVVGDFFCLWWLSSQGLFPVTMLGVVWNDSIVVPGLIFDAAVFVILVHYGWHIGKTPRISKPSYFHLVGIIFGLVALAHFARIAFGLDLILDSWVTPLWISWLGVVVPGYLSYMSFKLASEAGR